MTEPNPMQEKKQWLVNVSQAYKAGRTFLSMKKNLKSDNISTSNFNADLK